MRPSFQKPNLFFFDWIIDSAEVSGENTLKRSVESEKMDGADIDVISQQG